MTSPAPAAALQAPPSAPQAATSTWDRIGAGSLKKALDDTSLIDAAFLANLADSGGILPRWQDVPPEAVVSLEEMEAWTDTYTVAVLVVS